MSYQTVSYEGALGEVLTQSVGDQYDLKAIRIQDGFVQLTYYEDDKRVDYLIPTHRVLWLRTENER